MNTARFSTMLLIVFTAITGCATPIVEQQRTGFISDYSKLKPTSKNTYETVGDTLSSYTKFIAKTKAGLLITTGSHPESYQGLHLKHSNPYLAFAKLALAFQKEEQYSHGVHPSAHVDPTSNVSSKATIMANVVIGKSVTIGDDAVIFPGVFIGDNVSIGKNTIIKTNTVT